MNADLMGTPRLQPAFHIRKLAEALEHTVMGHGIPAVFFINAHLLSVHRVAADGPAYSPLILLHHAVNHSIILSRYGVHFQLLSNGVMRHIVFADDENACRIHIDAVDDSRSHHAVDAG